MSVGIVGLGYVGLPLAVSFAEAGEQVIGIEVNARRVAQLRCGESYIEDVPSEKLQAIADRFQATTRISALAKVDAIVVCVPTPLTPNREPDLSPLVDACQAIASVLQPGQLVVLESTTYPGTTRERALPILEESGLTAGEDFLLAFSPERVDPGRTDHTLRTTPKIVAGHTETCGNAAEALYGLICDQLVRVSAPEVAEMAKLLENIFRSVNIALINEMAELADRMGIDIWEVIDAASTKPYGFMRFEPGPGMGGHCLPVDPFYLSWKAREHDFSTEFIELAGKVNQHAPYLAVEKVERRLNELGKPVKGTRIGILGVAYKAGVGDIRESPALKIIQRLGALGAEIAYHDPFVASLPQFGLEGGALPDVLEFAEVVVIVTAHPDIDHSAIAERHQVVDLRGVTRSRRAVARPVQRPSLKSVQAA
ncbi:nucleotide sugar dehydrogenase [Baekduia soli]|uniref:Nucleotide sugar dehydrogenase n=1 Tax=Baekduia soli TaxID=496014 RepID=A0A5B8UBT5_9ACTN|nr:nucleotide sugar dehydrogenase [Baekduia soli]